MQKVIPGALLVPIDRVERDPAQSRCDWKHDEGLQRLEELTQSVRELGIVQPLLVRQEGECYVVMAGGRLLAAARRAGMTEVPVVVRNGDSATVPNRLAPYEEWLVTLWERLVSMLGIHTVRVLLDRAIWQTAQRHPDIALIHHDDADFTFGALESSYAAQTQEEIEAAFDDLSADLLLILARLLGREKARRLCADYPGSRPAGACGA
jgi:ParB-like nuclease domain